MTYKILQGDNRETLKTIPDNSIDAIVTDPPYGIDFLGKSWDANTGALETYQECLRVLKPGGHILAFSAARTYHHLAITLEQAGFEIRDQIMWIYSSGFPKSQDIAKSIERTNKKKNRNDDGTMWSGWGTQLKPAHEPIAFARKPIKQSIAKNCQQYGVGALNIDAARVPFEGDKPKPATFKNGISYREHTEELYEKQVEHATERVQEYNDAGRFPANVLGEIPDYQKYFYCPKVSRKERHIGHTLEIDRANMVEIMGGYWCDDKGTPGTNGKSVWLPHTGLIYAHGLTQVYADWCKKNNKDSGNVGNNHPTVKPIELMKYLIKLITPPGGTVLDPFNGSGSTGCAAVELGHPYIGCELDPAYVEIAEKRIAAWLVKDQVEPEEKPVEPAANTFVNLFEEE
jgi:site-specific DNA-methyltransferase (adenine-specific)